MWIIDLGNTGRTVAKRAKAFEMHVLAYDRFSFGSLLENTDEFFCLDQGDTIGKILAESDFLVLSCLLPDETYHMIGREQFNKMKSGAFLINITRGAIVDQDALYEALKTRSSPEPVAMFLTQSRSRRIALFGICPVSKLSPNIYHAFREFPREIDHLRAGLPGFPGQ